MTSIKDSSATNSPAATGNEALGTPGNPPHSSSNIRAESDHPTAAHLKGKLMDKMAGTTEHEDREKLKASNPQFEDA